MKYKRFEELPVWKDAIELAVRVFRFTADHIQGRYSLEDQMERAAVFRFRTTSLKALNEERRRRCSRFCISREALCGEIRSMLCLFDRCRFSRSQI